MFPQTFFIDYCCLLFLELCTFSRGSHVVVHLISEEIHFPVASNSVIPEEYDVDIVSITYDLLFPLIRAVTCAFLFCLSNSQFALKQKGFFPIFVLLMMFHSIIILQLSVVLVFHNLSQLEKVQKGIWGWINKSGRRLWRMMNILKYIYITYTQRRLLCLRLLK